METKVVVILFTGGKFEFELDDKTYNKFITDYNNKEKESLDMINYVEQEKDTINVLLQKNKIVLLIIKEKINIVIPSVGSDSIKFPGKRIE